MKKEFSASKFFLKVATLIVIFLVVIFAAPLALNINGYKSELENKLSTALNTNVRIEGDIAMSPSILTFVLRAVDNLFSSSLL